MKLIKKLFSFKIKLSQDYNSCEVGESIEVELDDSSITEQQANFNIMKDELIGRVKLEAKTQLDLLNAGKNLLKTKGDE